MTSHGFITFQLCWVAIGSFLWTTLYSLAFPQRGVAASSFIVVMVGTIVAWPVSLVAALRSISRRRRQSRGI